MLTCSIGASQSQVFVQYCTVVFLYKTKLSCALIFCRERIVMEYENTGDLLVDLGSDQTSLHNPFSGGYYPVQVLS